MRRMRGIWPPSNPGRVWPPARAVWPFPPRPAVLPMPDPGPRPLRIRARCEPAGARRLDRVTRTTSAAGALVRGFLVLGFLAVFVLAFPFAFAIAYSRALAGVTSMR